ncbi:MAG: sulfatase, partial [Phycisphaerae bacterium]|nr:sulfatase [Phycisphaerae bacterium]
PYRAVQEGGWKLIVSARPARQWLFHLATDPHERRDLAGAEPQQLARLQALMKAHHDDAAPPLWPSFIELPVAIDKTLDQPLLADDEVAYWFN